MSNPKWKYIFGVVTITTIIGGTVYVIIKSKQAKEAEEDAITLKEARELVEERNSQPGYESNKIKIQKGSDGDDELIFQVPIQEIEETGVRKIQGIRPSMLVMDEEDDEEEEYDDIDELVEGPSIEPLKDFMYYEDDIDPKEDKTLRYDPNSVDAKHQFIRMELADWEPNHDVYRIMLQLFEFPFVPTTDGDEMLRTQVIDYKVQFFGFNSRWNKEVSFADIVFHYARGAEFNCGESVQYWVEYFLDFNEFAWDSTSQEVDTLLMRLNSHSYFNQERQTFGLFGLTRESMDQAIKIANRNIDRSVTYEIEFNEFLKSCL